MLKNSKFFEKIKWSKEAFVFSFFLISSPLYCAQQALLDGWNRRVEQEGHANGLFQLDQARDVIFAGGAPPAWAVDEQCRALGITTGYGTGGINPFKIYTRGEYHETALHHYFLMRGFTRDVWGERGPQRDSSGTHLLRGARRKLGPDVFKDMHEYQLRVAARNDFWRGLREEAVPSLIKIFSQPKFIGLIAVSVFLLIGFPLLIWNTSKAILNWIFVRRPTILGEKDSDVYGNFFHRIFFKYPKLPDAIVNEVLRERLDALVANNQLITKKNRGSIFREPEKTPYPHILAYGDAGVGKTLFAKNLAKKSGMHFMYLTVADLSQLPEEEALETLKNFFAYARRYAPCVLIIDEADRLFAGEDVKSQKLATLFQREFAKAVDENIQLFFISNYPWRFPEPILSRMSTILGFEKPDFETQLKLFKLHLGIALARQKKQLDSLAGLEEVLEEQLIEGLVGRDIESISVAFSLEEQTTPRKLRHLIKVYKKSKADLKDFREAHETKPRPKIKEKNKKLW